MKLEYKSCNVAILLDSDPSMGYFRYMEVPELRIPPDWATNPPSDLETRVAILEAYADELSSKNQRGATLREIFKDTKQTYNQIHHSVRLNEPQAFFKPSYEQALLLNAWVYGFNFPICFSANRIGKTSAFAFNGILWIFPNNPDWECFKTYTDHLNRQVATIPRPNIERILELQHFYELHPELVGDPTQSHLDRNNKSKLDKTRQLAPHLFEPAWPAPPIQHGGQIWLGAPDNEFHKRVIMRRWRELLPKSSILKDSETDRMFIVTTRSETNPKTTAHEIVCKSYESEETKWSGDAVTGIILTEGFPQSILNEIKNRIVNNGFASWDYTPAEPRNTGSKVALAYKVFNREEELPLKPFVFTKFSVRQAPEFIIPKQKRLDLIRMWENSSEGKARLEGDFYASSGLVLDKLDKKFHCLHYDIQQIQQLYPNGRFYRGLDPGRDHPTAAIWGYLSTNNIWFIYRAYSKRGTTISQRCQDIIELSHNAREKTRSQGGIVYWREVHPSPSSEVFVLTAVDYHLFKDDEQTGLPYAYNYNNEGLIVTESIHMGPEERAQKANSALDPNANPYLAHPETNKPPGAKIFFLINGFGIANMLDRFDQIFWDRYKQGDQKGEPKDRVQLHGDDELDALCYLICAPYVWTAHQPRRIEPKPNDLIKNRIAALQQEEEAAMLLGGFR